MAVRRVGQGLGIDPVDIYEPTAKDQPDSTFDSTVRVPIRPVGGFPRQPTQPPTPTLPTTPTTPTATPGIGGPTLPTTYNPQQLNFEGSTYSGPPVMSAQSAFKPVTTEALTAIQQFMDSTGITTGKDWRAQLSKDPQGFLASLDKMAQVSGASGAANDARRLADQIRKVLSGTTQAEDPAAKLSFLGQAAYNQAIERLKVLTAGESRGQDEQLMAFLESRGLLHSGIAAAEVARLQQARMENLYNAASSMAQLLMSGEMDYTKQQALTQLQYDLQKRNQEALANIQGEWAIKAAKAGQPNPWEQIAGTVAGTALPFILGAGKAPGTSPASTPYEDPSAWSKFGGIP